MTIPYIMSSNGISVVIDNKPMSINSSHPNFALVQEALRAKEFDKIKELMDIAASIEIFSNGKIKIVDGVLTYEDTVLNNVLVERILNQRKQGFDIDPMLNFLNNLMSNPSRTAIEELYLFLESNQLPITPDGHFLAYKRVRADYKDVHSATLLNKPGKVLSMPRGQVDDKRDSLCSTGLHFCSLEYLKHFSGERIVILKINPADVVSIPSDYNNSKGRTCKYVVVGEYTGHDTEEAFDTVVFDTTKDKAAKVKIKKPVAMPKRDANGRFIKKVQPARDQYGRYVSKV